MAPDPLKSAAESGDEAWGAHEIGASEEGLRVWIDATGSESARRVFGMSLLERLLRGLALALAGPAGQRVDLAEIRVALPEDAERPEHHEADAAAGLPVVWSREPGSAVARFGAALAQHPQDEWVALAADAVIDGRLLAHFLRGQGAVAFFGERGGVLLRARSVDLPNAEEVVDLEALAGKAVAAGSVERFSGRGFDTHIRNLRRDQAPYLTRLRSTRETAEAERFLFWSNYKGSTDFMTRYVYPPLVWWMLRPLARRRVHPNWVTAVDIAATVAAIPFFAAGAWLPGFLCAYLMSVLDSVDGKLARVTFTSSRLGNVLDHGLDIVHPPFWYLAWGYAVGGGDTSSAPFVASLWLFGLYVADRLMAPMFKHRTGRSIHGFTPLDERMRTFISRRNVNLPLFTLAVACDALVPGLRVAEITLYGIVAWQAVCLVFHADRVVRYWSRPAQERALAARTSPA